MSHDTTSLDISIGREALDDLVRRGLLVIDPFVGYTTGAGNPEDRFTAAVQGARIGIRLSAAASRLARHRSSRAGGVLEALALTSAGSKGVHEIQLDLGFSIWRSSLPGAPQRLTEALRAIPRSDRGRGKAIEHLDRTSRSTPWFRAGSGSFGYAGIVRAIGIAGSGPSAPTKAMADMAVTHAHPVATWTAATLTAVLEACVASDRPQLAQRLEELLRVLAGSPIGDLAVATAHDVGMPLADVARRAQRGPTCETVFPIIFAAARTDENPTRALRDLALMGAPTPVLAVAGAILAARHGVTAFPTGWTAPTATDPQSVDRHRSADHIWVLLDRSGSMQSIRGAMETGFDQFVAQQRIGASTPTDVTVIQFDSQDPHDVLVDTTPLAKVPSIVGRLAPRGMTPLYDAIGLLLDRAEQDPRPGNQKLVVVVTDGQENASRVCTRQSIFERIAKLEAQGWTFVYLGANQDSYSAARGMRIAEGNTSNFTGSVPGVARAYNGLGRATLEWRVKKGQVRADDVRDFWGDVREAEEL